MNQMETTTTEHSLHKRIVVPGANGSSGSGVSVSSHTSNNLIEIKDQKLITPAIYGDKALIKQVIGAGPSNNQNQHSILKKNSPIQVPTTATFLTSTSNSIVKGIARPKADAVVKSQQQQQQHQQQQSASLARSSECKLQKQQQIAISTSAVVTTLPAAVQQSLIRFATPENHTILKRPLPMIQHKTFSTPTTSLGMQATPSSHIIYKTINGNSAAANFNEIFSSSLLTRPTAEQLTKRRQSYRDVQIKTVPEQLSKRRASIRDVQIKPANNMDLKPMTILRTSRNSSETPSSVEVTQISSTVTLTKSAAMNCKQTNNHSSPLVTIEKKNSNVSLLNPTKQGKSVFGNGAEHRMSVDESVTEGGQKSLLIKQPSPTNIVKTPPKTPPAPPVKHRQQSLLKVNSLARLLHTSPRTKRSKSMTAMGNTIKKRGRPRKNRRLSTASDGELLQKAVEQLTLEEAIKVKKEPSPLAVVNPTTTITSLLCNDKIEKIPSSSSNNSSLEITSQTESKEATKPVDRTYFNSAHMNMVLGMLSTFNMLTWKERVGKCKQSEMRFQLNELNLVQIAEKCQQRNKVHTVYDKPIFERDSTAKISNYSDALYCCRRCECHGAAVDFLAPDFCSYDCFRRESRKRSKVTITSREKEVQERFKKIKTSTLPAVVNPEVQIKHLVPKRFFTWASHLNTTNAQPAPVDLFPNPYPCGDNLFEVGMKLEAIDPEHNSLFCVCTVVEKKGYRLKLKFDGYSKIHNFWVNADSMDIFPPGWCSKTNRVLQPPKGMNLLTFNWPTYLNSTKSSPALRSLFTHLNSSSKRNPFKVGMRLEAVDLKNTGKVCVATVADVLDNRILVHFDGWDESYDYWIDINSPYIHPIGWHKQNGLELVPPPDWDEYFDWPEYLEFMRSEAAWPAMFLRRDAIEFEAGMKLEVVDFKNPSLIRPATVICRDEYKVLVHLDGWPSGLTYWVNDDSPDIHPIRWAEETGHDLEPPPGFEQLNVVMPCPVYGCRGIGHATRIDVYFHANMDTCPYEEKNWSIEIERPSRIDEVGRYTYEEKILVKEEIEVKSPDIVENTKQYNKKSQHSEKNRSSERRTTTTTNSNATATANIKVEKQQPEPISWDKEIKIAREYLCDYGPRLKQNYMIWCDNSDFNSNCIKKNPLEWTTEETAHYISTKCHPIGHLFKREDIDGAALLSMHQSDLTDILKLKLGPSIKIFSHILHLRQQVVSRFIKTTQ